MWNLEFNPEFKCIKEVLTGDKNATTIGSRDDWYQGSVKYWNEQPTTVDGVLGGYGVIHDADSATSGQMIDDMRDRISGFDRAIDLGAGIGRIAKTTLVPRFAAVDLLEPSEAQINKARENVP